MKITFAPSDTGVVSRRLAVDAMGGHIVRIWVSERSPEYAGENFDAVLRYATADDPDQIILRMWNRAEGIPTSREISVIVDRIHVY